jgi:isopentenyl diphosphate isomerase/L-lactate dehydrogenase-like FMN-dependent dehydrogenase
MHSANDHAAFQNEIYLAGMGGIVPELPMTYDGLVAAAKEKLSPQAFAYVAGSAGLERTADANRDAFHQWKVVPRMMVDIDQRDTSTNVLGLELPSPIMTAPIGVQGIIHREAEVAVARAAAGLGVPMLLSTVSSYSMEDVADASGDGSRWFQLYWPDEREVAASFVHRAEAAGYSAIVVTLDTKVLGWRPRDLATAYLPFLQGEGLANYRTDPAFLAGLDGDWDDNLQMAILRWVSTYTDRTVTWQDLAWLRSVSNLPIVVKGVLHPDDAREAVDAGVDAIIVSNHGGRQVDNAIGALTMLPEVVDVAGEVPVLFDSGIRSGADVFTAVCLGAKAVLVGRPWVYGLALAGADGVTHVLRSIMAEFDVTMALTGQTRVADLGPHLLRQA